MRLLITGASGLLGNRLVRLAVNAGHEVYSIYNTHPIIEGNAQRVDLSDETAVNETVNGKSPDVVIHAAAITDVDFCEQNPELAMRVNGHVTGLLARACQENSCFLVFVSTDYVFDGVHGHYDEDDEPNPVNVYGESKLFGERQLILHRVSHCIARTSVLYGWGREHRANFATWLHENLRKRHEIKVVTDQYSSPTLNTQLARMLLEVAERREENIIHLAGATRTNRYEFALHFARKFGFNEKLLIPVRSESVGWKAKRPFDSSLDITKAQQTLDNKPSTMEDALKEFAREAPKP